MSRLYVLNGPDKGQAFEMTEGDNYIGRSSDNDFMIRDETVSRRHLKIIKRGKRYFIVDLKSMNGTFFNGNYLVPGFELEVRVGVPIMIGMRVIGIGHTSREILMPFLDSIGLTKEGGADSTTFEIHGSRINQKKLELIYKVISVLEEKKSIHEALHEIPAYIFEFLRGIDRAAIILIDPMKKRIADVIYRSYKPREQKQEKFCKPLVKQVLAKREPIVISHVEAEKSSEIIDTLKTMGIESVMCAPMIANAELMGAMYVDCLEKSYIFIEEDLTLLVDVGQRIALAWQEACFLSL